MQWIHVAHPSAAVQVFNLVENNYTKTSLHYHPLQKTLRIRASNGQRVFSVKGNAQQHQFMNEYGFEVGRLEMDQQHHGSLLLENNLYAWRMVSNATPDMRIYEANALVAECRLDPAVLKKGRQQELAALVLCTCWSITGASRQPIAAKRISATGNAVPFASSTLADVPLRSKP